MESQYLQRKFPLTLVADGLQSPANIGSLFRVSEAFGIEKIYFCNSLINFDSPRLKKTARSSLGYPDKKIKHFTFHNLAHINDHGFKCHAGRQPIRHSISNKFFESNQFIQVRTAVHVFHKKPVVSSTSSINYQMRI